MIDKKPCCNREAIKALRLAIDYIDDEESIKKIKDIIKVYMNKID